MKKLLFIIFITIINLTTAFAQTDSLTVAVPASEGIDSVRKNRILVYPGFGLSLIRNEFAPSFFINVGFNHRERYEVNVNTASYFFFERDDNKNYEMFRNTFLNAEFLLNFSFLSR